VDLDELGNLFFNKLAKMRIMGLDALYNELS
jgi:hypothetical protein